MPKVVKRVDRDPAKQDTWSRNFFEKAVFGVLLKPTNLKQDLFTYSLTIQELAGGKRKDKHTPTQEMIDEVIASLPPFDLLETLAYTNKSSWTFTWATGAEYELFLLKWM